MNTESASVPEVGDVDATDYAAIVRAAGLSTGTALTSNAANFNGDLSKPLMGVVLVDKGGAAELRSGLSGLSAPITFAVDTELEGAADVAQVYRNAGFEVVVALPTSGAAMALEDVPLRLAAAMDAVPGATTILDVPNGQILRDRELMQVALQTLRVTGHGLLTYGADGGNTVPQFADQVGVFSDVVSTVIDDDPSPEAMLAKLEQSVLEARRAGAVVVVGQMTPETVSTLFQWVVGAQASDITIAPISVVLR